MYIFSDLKTVISFNDTGQSHQRPGFSGETDLVIHTDTPLSFNSM